MKLKKLSIQGFQSFSDSGELNFDGGFNLVIGQNNSGKSAVLRSMLPKLIDPSHFHRTPERWDHSTIPTPRINFEIETHWSEICQWILQFRQTYYFPVPYDDMNDITKVIDKFEFDNTSFKFKLFRDHKDSFESHYPSHGSFNFKPGPNAGAIQISPQNGKLQYQPHFSMTDNLPSLIWDAFRTDMFYFSAERFAIGESGTGYAARLHADASNLPNILHTIRNERGDTFDKLVDHLRCIFPTVGNISVRSREDNNNFEIRIWPTKSMQRVELSFPLSSSGTGVAQAIAILCAVMTSDSSILVIDEINSFLHPLAVKSLIRILQTEYSNHQYIISTHAPEVISFGNAKTIHLVKRFGYESHVERLDPKNIDSFREVAQHLGISMSDVFAADKIIWVEGPTEELIFPYIFQLFSGSSIPSGTIVTAVAATGDFNRKRDREIVYEVYRKVSVAAAPLIVSTVFSFDMEQLTPSEMASMTKESGNILKFLPRRHIECYLLDPAAIASFINGRLESHKCIKSSQVQQKIAELAESEKFRIKEWGGDIADLAWLTNVDAAKLISATVTEISESAVVFLKKEDSLELVQQIVASDKESLRPLYEYVESLVASVTDGIS